MASGSLVSVADFLLWYAKDKSQVKYHQLFEPLTRAEKVEHMSSYAMVELPDGSTRSLTREDEVDPGAHLLDGARLYRRMVLTPPGSSTTGRSDPYHWRGHDWPCPPGEHWRVSVDGLDRLAALGRLDAAGPGLKLAWRRYENEVPGRRVHNVWLRQMSASDKRYVGQTADTVIERCILMATDPGDLLLDPTCGGGTTALVAERWGRRWITCDTSPVAAAVARQRLTTATFAYWTLADSPEGVAAEAELFGLPACPEPEERWGHDPGRGFVYERAPTVSASVLAYDEQPPPTLLVDQHRRTKGVVRVTSPFTVESESPWSHVPFDEAGNGSAGEIVAATPVEHAQFASTVVEAF